MPTEVVLTPYSFDSGGAGAAAGVSTNSNESSDTAAASFDILMVVLLFNGTKEVLFPKSKQTPGIFRSVNKGSTLIVRYRRSPDGLTRDTSYLSELQPPSHSLPYVCNTTTNAMVTLYHSGVFETYTCTR